MDEIIDNLTQPATTLAEEFYDWVNRTGREFRGQDHKALVKSFNPDAEFWWHRTDPFSDDTYYSDLSCVKFPDGSITSFNYKGEVMHLRSKR